MSKELFRDPQVKDSEGAVQFIYWSNGTITTCMDIPGHYNRWRWRWNPRLSVVEVEERDDDTMVWSELDSATEAYVSHLAGEVLREA